MPGYLEHQPLQIRGMLDELAMIFYGRKRSESFKSNTCVACGKSTGQFRDNQSKYEYEISGFCQDCQDEAFASTESTITLS